MDIGDDLLKSGDLDGARQALVEVLRRTPEDAQARMFLWQLMALSGDWDKAVNQLRSLATISPEAQILATVYHQAIEAEKLRADAYAGKAQFNVLVSSSPWIDALAKGLSAICRGEQELGSELRDGAFDEAGDTPGTVDDKPFGWIADVDSRLGPCFEAVVAGKWGLIPFEAVISIKTEGPKDLRDVIWLPVQMSLRSGQSAAALIPARYPGTEASTTALKLGRATNWLNEKGHEVPVGQRLWTTDSDLEFGVLDFSEILLV